MYGPAAPSLDATIDLGGLAACQGLAQRSQAQVAAIGSVQRLSEGATLFAEGDPATKQTWSTR